jgi:hypothetical protein
MMKSIQARRFQARATPIPSATPGTMDSSLVTIFDGDVEIGNYQRNYPSFAETTFEPFEQGGEWYALYSPDYTLTRIMKLPECRDIGSEDHHSNGFCPVELFVPRYRMVTAMQPFPGPERESLWFESDGEERRDPSSSSVRSSFSLGPWRSLAIGFVAGCHWGDDSSWKLEVFDLSRAADGVLHRTARFGHLQLGKLPLADAIRLNRFLPYYELRATIIQQQRWDVRTGALIDQYDE